MGTHDVYWGAETAQNGLEIIFKTQYGYVCPVEAKIWLYNGTEPAFCLLNNSERLIYTINKAGTFLRELRQNEFTT